MVATPLQVMQLAWASELSRTQTQPINRASRTLAQVGVSLAGAKRATTGQPGTELVLIESDASTETYNALLGQLADSLVSLVAAQPEVLGKVLDGDNLG